LNIGVEFPEDGVMPTKSMSDKGFHLLRSKVLCWCHEWTVKFIHNTL